MRLTGTASGRGTISRLPSYKRICHNEVCSTSRNIDGLDDIYVAGSVKHNHTCGGPYVACLPTMLIAQRRIINRYSQVKERRPPIGPSYQQRWWLQSTWLVMELKNLREKNTGPLRFQVPISGMRKIRSKFKRWKRRPRGRRSQVFAWFRGVATRNSSIRRTLSNTPNGMAK